MPLDESDVRRRPRDVSERTKVEAVAISFLHAYANPDA